MNVGKMKGSLMMLAMVGLLSLLQAQSYEVQQLPPQVGSVSPKWELTGVTHFSKRNVSLHDFAGKWLILDFWGVSCTSCIKSFPKLNELQQQFKDNIQIVLVASNKKAQVKNTQQLYERVVAKCKLELPSAYDSSLFRLFDVGGVPHVVIIDPSSVIRAVTYSSEVTESNLKEMIGGTFPPLQQKGSVYYTLVSQPTTQPSVELREEEVFQSSLRKTRYTDPFQMSINVKDNLPYGYYRNTKASLSLLYKIAYLGETGWTMNDSLYLKVWPQVIVAAEEADPFVSDSIKNSDFYNYFLQVPLGKSSKSYLMWAMQCDLKKYFSYNVKFEKRLMPCLALVQTGDTGKIRAKGGTKEIISSNGGLRMQNQSIHQLLLEIDFYYPALGPFIDETGITTRIDISLDTLLLDFEDLKKALSVNGLGFRTVYKEFDVLVLTKSEAKW